MTVPLSFSLPAPSAFIAINSHLQLRAWSKKKPMTSPQPGPTTSSRSLALATTALATGLFLAGLAAMPTAMAQPAATEAARSFAIPAQPLPDALRQFSTATGLRVAGAEQLPAGLTSPGAAGTLTPAQALEQLLASSGFTADLSTAGTARLVPPSTAVVAADGSTLVLPEVRVQATAWRAWEHMPGYVAPVTTTGTKTDTPLIEAPQSVGVVTRDQINDQAAQNVSQALRYTAGVLSEVRPTSRYDSVFVRGFGGQGTGAAYVNFLDGLRQQRGISYAIPTVDPWLLERIEVLRGPASVLYGQTGAGGLVNLVSRRPTEESIHEVRLEAGTDATLQAKFDFGGKLTEDGKFLYRLTGMGSISSTQYDYTEAQRIAIAPAITWRPDDSTTLTVLGNYQYEPQGGFYNFVPASGTVLANPYGKLSSNFFAGDPNFNLFQRRQASIGYQLEHRFDETWTVRQNFRYQHIDSEFRVVSPRSITGNRTMNRSVAHSIEHADTLALDNQAQADFNTGEVHHTALMGVDWSRASAKRRLGSSTSGVGTLDMFAPIYYQNITWPTLATTTQITDQLGFYAQDQVAYGNWRFNIGLRQDFATSETVTRASNTHTSQDDTALTWRAGLLYLFDNGFAPYVSYSTSFLPNSGTMAPQRGGNTFDPTTGEQYEVGIKYQPPGMNSFIQVAGYQITQQNVLTTDPLYTTFSQAIGEIRSRGIEVEGRASLNDNLDLIGTYAYTNAEITRSNTAGVSGNAVPQVPEHSAAAWANYRFRDTILKGLSLGGGIRYVGSTPGDEANTFRVPSVTLYDAAIRYDLGAAREDLAGVELYVNGTNLFDKEYVASCSSTTSCFFGNRRVVLGGVSVKW